MTPQTTALETEVTLDVGEGWVVPDLVGVEPAVVAVTPGVRQRLTATYHDTDGYRLLADRVTLRRRTGGTDPGWHLKLPVGVDSRLEVRHAAERPGSAVPDPLLALVRSRVLGQQVQPVVVLRTQRTVRRLLDVGGGVLAEVVDDRVTATSPQGGQRRWREVEVELVAGDRALLAAVVSALVAHGARPAATQSKLARALADVPGAPRVVPSDRDPASGRGPTSGHGPTSADVVRAYLAAQVAEVVARDPEIRLALPEAVHRQRVAVRRLRSTLVTFRRLLAPRAVRRLRRELRWLAGVLGGARDAEVLRTRLLGGLGDLPEGCGEVPDGPLGEELDRAVREAQVALTAALDSPRYLALLVALRALVQDGAWAARAARRPGRLRREVHRAVRRVGRAVRRASRRPAGREREVALHEARKAAKAARYAAECVAGHDPRAVATVTRMTALQDLLGEHQDGIVAMARLGDLLDRARSDGRATTSLDALVRAEQERQGDGSAVLAAAAELLRTDVGRRGR